MIEDIRYAPIVGRTLQFKTKDGCVKILKGSPNYAYLPVDANHRKFFNFAGEHIYPGFVNQNRVAIRSSVTSSVVCLVNFVSML